MISVVMTNYNYAIYLAVAIEAVLNQSMQPKEFIIVDDASTDGSMEIIEKYSHENPIIHIVRKKQNGGVLASLNDGLRMAKCRYVIFASSDDVILPGLFAESLDLLEQYPQSSMCAGQTKIYDERKQPDNQLNFGPVLPRTGYYTPELALKYMKRYGFWFVGNTVMFRRQMLTDVGGFPGDLGPLCDSFISQVLALSYGFCYIRKPLASMRINPSSYSMKARGNIQYCREIVENAVKYMRTTYRDIFPDAFIRDWKEISLFLNAVYSWRNEVLFYQLKFLNDTIKIVRSKPGLIDKCFCLLIKTSSYIQFFIVLKYFFTLFFHRPLFWQYLSFKRFLHFTKRVLRFNN